VRELLDTGVWEVDEVYPEPGYATALRTPLCLAVAQAHVETVRVLLDAGAAVWNAEFQRRRGGRWESPFGWVKDQMVEGMLRVTYKTRSESW
jgi:nucleoside 2-deoxyribosyltransferase